MPDLPPRPNTDGDMGDETAGAPRWVKVFGIVVIVLALLFVILHLAGGGLLVGHKPR